MLFRSVLSWLLLVSQYRNVFSFAIGSHGPKPASLSRHCASVTSSSSSTRSTTNDPHGILQHQIEDFIRENRDPRALIMQLEALESTKEPNRQENFKGAWQVWWTDCPPPSNGVLGPFQGTSSQYIRNDGGYQNFLKVAPNDWLTATLDGVWEDWDGVVIRDKSDTNASNADATSEANNQPSTQDWGADHWRVTFKQLQIKVFGIALFTKEFEANTSRVWRTTYLKDDVRIVRAGKTGRQEDEVIFYTKREAAPILFKY